MKYLQIVFLGLWSLALPAGAAAVYSSPMLLSVSYSAANTYSYHYIQFSNVSFTIPTNSRLEYDVYLPIDSADFNGAVDMGGGTLSNNLRDYQAPSTGLFIRDQNYLRAHGFEDLSNYAKGQWYHRTMDMGSAGGLSATGMALATDTGNNAANGSPANLAGFYNGYFDNIKFTNAYGVTTLDLYSNLAALPQGGTSASALWPQGGVGGVATATARVSVVTGLQFSVTPSANTADGSSPITVTVKLVGPGGNIPYVKIRLASSRLQDTLSPLSGTSDAFGNLTVVVKSTLAGSSLLTVLAGPFSGSSSLQFTAGAATAYSFKPYNTLTAVSTAAAVMGMVARDAFGNDTVTARSAWVHSSDANLQISSDGVVYVAALAGITLTPSVTTLQVWIRSVGGSYPRAPLLLATDTVAAGALGQGSRVLSVNNVAPVGLQALLPAAGTAGVAMTLTLTAVDSGSAQVFSTAAVSLSSGSPTGQFSLDDGNTWVASTAVSLVNGQFILLYRDTKIGLSTVNTACTLSSPSVSSSISAGSPALISGSANPNAMNLSAPNNTSVLSTLVSDVYGNPVSGTAVFFYVATPTTSTLSGATITTGVSGIASNTLTYVSTTADSGVYVRASVAGVKPSIVSLSLSSADPTKLNLSPAPSTTGVNIATLMTLLAQDNSANTGYSSHTVRLTSNSANLSFSGDGGGSWFTTLDVSMTAGRRDFLYRSSASTTLAGVTVTATDQTAPVLTAVQALVEIPRALLNVVAIQQPYANVSEGETGIPLTITVQNSGGTDAWLNPASCAPTFGGDSANYSSTFWAGNSLTVPAAATVSLFFTVNVGAAATVGSRSIDGQVGGIDSVTGFALNDSGATSTSQWTVAGPATQMTVLRSNGVPTAGAAYSVTVTVLDAGSRTVTSFANGITLSTRLVSSPALTATGQVNLLYPAWNRGVAVFSHSYDRTEGVYLKAYAGALAANSLGITPVAGALNRYFVFNPATVTAGAPFSLTLTPVDLYGNTRTGAASVSFTPRLLSGALGSASPAVASLNTSAGSASTFVQAYTAAEVLHLVATAGGFSSLTWETQSLTVLPAAAASYRLENPATGVVGVYFPVTVTAIDAYGNTASVAHAITLTVNGGAGSLGTAWLQLASGVSVVAQTYSQAGTIKLVATGPGVASVLTLTTAIVFTAPTATPTYTPTPTPTTSATPTFSSTSTPTSTATPSPTATPSFTTTPTHSPTSTPTETPTATPSSSTTPTASSSATPTQTATHTPTPSHSPSSTATGTVTPSATPTETGTGTATPSHSPSSTTTNTATPSTTPTQTGTGTATPTHSPSSTTTNTATPSTTPTQTGTGTATPTASATTTNTPTATSSATGTATPTHSATATGTSTATPTTTETGTQTSTPTVSSTGTHSPTATPTGSSTATPTGTPTSTESPSPTETPTQTGTATVTGTATQTQTTLPTDSATATTTPTASPSLTASATPSCTATATASPSITPPWTATDTPTVTPTPQFAQSGTDKTVLAPTLLRRGDRLKVFFAERPASCKVDIFTLNGERVAEVESGLDGQPSWDPGLHASGVYLLVVETHFVSGHYERFRTKVALVQ